MRGGCIRGKLWSVGSEPASQCWPAWWEAQEAGYNEGNPVISVAIFIVSHSFLLSTSNWNTCDAPKAFGQHLFNGISCGLLPITKSNDLCEGLARLVATLILKLYWCFGQFGLVYPDWKEKVKVVGSCNPHWCVLAPLALEGFLEGRSWKVVL